MTKEGCVRAKELDGFSKKQAMFWPRAYMDRCPETTISYIHVTLDNKLTTNDLSSWQQCSSTPVEIIIM